MSGVSKAISDELYKKVLEGLRIAGRQGDVSRKLQAIKSAKEHGITLVAKIYGVSRLSIMNWIRDFDSMGAEGLKIKKGRGRKPIVIPEEEEVIRNWLEQDNTITIKVLRFRIEQEFGKKIGKTATHDLMKKLGFSYITPRPKHYKQVEEKQAEFNKKSTRKNSIKPQ
jgi:transposase